MAKPKAYKTKKVRIAAETVARKDAMVELIDRLKVAKSHGLTLSTREVADLYNAALIAESTCNPSEAPKSGPMVGFRYDGQVAVVRPSPVDKVRYADFRYGHVVPVFAQS